MKTCEVFILCEGRSDAEIIKLLISKLGFEFVKNIVITDCEGRDKLYEIASIVVLLTRLFRRVRSLAIIIDADNMEFKARLQSFLNSLRSKGFEVTDIQRIGDQLYKLIYSEARRSLQIYVSINGIVEYGFTKHELEDHIVKLLELSGQIIKSEINQVEKAKDLLTTRNISIANVIIKSENTLVEQAFSHITTLIRCLAVDP